MDFMRLAAIACRQFADVAPEGSNRIVEVKGDNSRDVVTELDMRLHQAVTAFVAQSDQATVVMSEEDAHHDPVALWQARSLVIVDPLDGSNNFALSIPGYGFMATHLMERCLVSSVVVLPERSVYLVWDSTGLVTSRPVNFLHSAPSASIYYAYPPSVDESMAAARARVLRVVDQQSAGVYRSGSACIGLFQLLVGAHRAFIGHQVRVWDVLAYFPLLSQLGFHVHYRIEGLSTTVIATADEQLATLLEEALNEAQAPALHVFDSARPIVIEA